MKLCAECGGGFDGFRALDARGRFCSPACLTTSRSRRSARSGAGAVIGEAEGLLPLPTTICLGSPDIIVVLGTALPAVIEPEMPGNVA